MVTLHYELKSRGESWRLVCLPFQHLMRKIRKIWRQDGNVGSCVLKILMVALDVKDDKRKRALLLHYIGERTLDIFETLADIGTADNYKKACDALNKQFTPQKNTSFEVYEIRNTKQRADETLDQYHVRLVQMSKYCEFEKPDKEIKAQTELGTVSKQLRRHTFRNPKLTLCELLAFGRTQEIMESDAKGLGHDFKRDSKVQDVQQVKFDRKSFETRNALNVDLVGHTLQSVQQKAKPATNVKSTIILLDVVSRNRLQMNQVKSLSKRVKISLKIQFKENIIESSKLKLQSPHPVLILMSMCTQYKATRLVQI